MSLGPYVCGIDFDSFAVHCVLLPLESDAATYQLIDLDVGPGDALDRCRRCRDLMPARGAWNDTGVVAIALERPMGASRIGVAQQMRVQGAILACLPREPLVTELAPPTWKLHSVGKGNASKDEVAAWAFERWQTAGVPQDAYDAFCIAWACRAQLAFGEVAAA